MIPPGFIQDLLARTDIADVVGQHVELKRGGANLMGLCPFHGEKSPSFSVNCRRSRRTSSFRPLQSERWRSRSGPVPSIA